MFKIHFQWLLGSWFSEWLFKIELLYSDVDLLSKHSSVVAIRFSGDNLFIYFGSWLSVYFCEGMLPSNSSLVSLKNSAAN